jgi:prolyl-tRNA synthetase
METFLAISGVPGVKSPSERFAGAEETLTIEAMMQDFKALQSCTSHFLGQNFAKAFDVTYVDKHNESQYVWSTSRGMSTRIMGALVMSHSDDAGLILPPAIAPVHVVIVPIFRSAEQLDAIEAYLAPALDGLRKQTLTTVGQFAQLERPVTVKFDTDDQNSPGWKFSEREMKGVPVRITV